MPIVSDATAEDTLEGDKRHVKNVDDVELTEGLTPIVELFGTQAVQTLKQVPSLQPQCGLKMQTSRDLWSLQHALGRKQSSQHQVKLVLFALLNPIERAPSLCLRHRCGILIRGTPK